MKNPFILTALFLFGLGLLYSCGCCSSNPSLMKVTTTKGGVSVSTVMPIDTAYANSLKDSADVKVKYLHKHKK